MRYLAILKDSFHETLDCKTFWVLLVVSSLMILLCGSVSFTALTPEESLKDIAQGFNLVSRVQKGKILFREYSEVSFRIEEARAVEGGEYAFRLRVGAAKAFHRLVRHWDALNKGRIQKDGDPIPDVDAPTEFDLQKKYLNARFREQQLTRVSVEAAGIEEEALLYQVKLKPLRPELLRGAHRVGIFFGLTGFRLPISAAMIVTTVEALLADWIAGWVGILFSIVVTASFVPDMLQKGRVDLLLAKPIHRSTLMITKYLGGMLFVFLNAVYLIGGCWLGLAARSGHWDAAFLWSIPILTLCFALLYSFSAWLGVLTRSPIVSILATLGLWFVSSSISGVRTLFRSPLAPTALPAWASKAIDVVYTILPKTGDLKEINNVLIARANLGEEALAAAQQTGVVPLDWPLILISSGAFLVFFLALACLRFSKRDY